MKTTFKNILILIVGIVLGIILTQGYIVLHDQQTLFDTKKTNEISVLASKDKEGFISVAVFLEGGNGCLVWVENPKSGYWAIHKAKTGLFVEDKSQRRRFIRLNQVQNIVEADVKRFFGGAEHTIHEMLPIGPIRLSSNTIIR